MRALAEVLAELFTFLRGRGLVAVALVSPALFFLAALIMRDYLCMSLEPALWAMAMSVPASGTAIRLHDREAAQFFVGKRWSLAVFMGFSLALNAMLAGAFVLPYWGLRVLINPACP